MARKRIYRTVDVEQVDGEELAETLPPGGCVVAVDLAKRDMVAAVASATGDVIRHLRFSHPKQTVRFLGLLETLRAAEREAVVVMEPTGTYGDALRAQLACRRFAVFRVSPKRCHDAAELFDGVPSQHDAKSTAILARLHAQGLSEPWYQQANVKREIRALVERREVFESTLAAHHGRLEALLARHWPELEANVDVRRRVSVLVLLEGYGCPAQVAANPQGVAALLHRVTRGRFSVQKISAITASARNSLGVPMLPSEQELVRELAGEMLRLVAGSHRVERQIAMAVDADVGMRRIARVTGRVTAAVLAAHLGNPTDYPSAAAYEKAAGLNLKERSSGTHKGRLAITKRGPGRVRRYLFLAALRQIQSNPLARAWYAKRSAFTANCRLKAVVALMRKLVRALWHVGRGASFDAHMLFDSRRLPELTRTARASFPPATQEALMP